MTTGERGRRVPAQVRAGRWRTAAALAVVVGLLLVGVAGVAVWRSRGVSEVGTASLPTPTPTERPAGGSGVPVTDGRPRADTPDAAPSPIELAIPAIGLTAPVDRVGIRPETGEFEVPDDVDRVGWYRFGPGLAATAGSIVIAGHVDGAGQGRGAFFRLAELAPGDRIEVRDAAGTGHAFEVVAREVHAKQELPLARSFARDGAPRLTLITCGGAFDSGQRRYSDNIVVTARPVG